MNILVVYPTNKAISENHSNYNFFPYLQHLEFDDDHVHEGKQYEYRVSAVNAAGSGPPSDVTDAIIAKQTRGKEQARKY